MTIPESGDLTSRSPPDSSMYGGMRENARAIHLDHAGVLDRVQNLVVYDSLCSPHVPQWTSSAAGFRFFLPFPMSAVG